MFTTNKASEILEGMISVFENQDRVNEIITKTIIECPDIPSKKWSYGNQFMTAIFGGWDSRGFRQWKAAGRRVKTGSKALYILIPIIKTEKKQDDDGRETETTRLIGFKCCPVFKAQDTCLMDGTDQEIEYVYTNRPDKLPELARIADKMGVKIDYAGTMRGEYGHYDPDAKEIKLSTPEESTMFHEIAHAIDDKLNGLGGDKQKMECIAEMAGNAIARVYGQKVNNKYTLKYIQNWSGKTGKDLGLFLYKIVDRISKIVEYAVKIDGQAVAQGAGV